MSGPPDPADALAIDAEHRRARVRFFEAFAAGLVRDGVPSLDELRDRSASMELGTGVVGFGDVEEAIPEREFAPPAARARWAVAGVTADAYREAAIAGIVDDVARAAGNLRAAAWAYVTAGLPYGLFLDEVVTGGRGAADIALTLLSGQAIFDEAEVADLLPLELAPPVRGTPQHLFAFLAAAGNAEVAPAARDLAAEPEEAGAVPVGAVGAPLGEWWRIGRALLAAEPPWDVLPLLTELADRHGERVRAAQAQGRYWTDGHSRVGFVDVDVVGAVALVARMFTTRFRVTLPPGELGPVSPRGLPTILAGLQLAAATE